MKNKQKKIKGDLQFEFLKETGCYHTKLLPKLIERKDRMLLAGLFIEPKGKIFEVQDWLTVIGTASYFSDARKIATERYRERIQERNKKKIKK